MNINTPLIISEEDDGKVINTTHEDGWESIIPDILNIGARCR
jgi:hypothetical protein